MIFWIYAIIWLACVWFTHSLLFGTILSVVLTCIVVLLLAMGGGGGFK